MEGMRETMPARPPGAGPPPGAATAGRCVVLCARGTDVPRVLLEGLAARGLKPFALPSEMAVMVDLAHRPASAVVVCEPSRWRRAHEVLAAIQRYYPSTACWQYGPAGPGGAWKLAPLTSGLSLDGGVGWTEDDDPSAAADEPLPERGSISQLLTPEELDMLIGTPLDDDEGSIAAPDDEV
jgi:hypothetical protein